MANYRILCIVFAVFLIANIGVRTAFAQSASYYVETVILVGEPVPDVPGATFITIGSADINDAGVLAFQGWYDDGGSSAQAVWLGQPDALSILAQSGTEPPGTPGRTFSSFTQVTLNENGAAAFFASLDQSEIYGSGIWLGKQISLSLIARSGEPAPGVEPRFFIDVDAGTTTNYIREINNLDEIAIEAQLNQTLDPNDEGIWVGDGSSLRLVTFEGEPAPGTQDSFRSFDRPILNDSGDILFKGFLTIDPQRDGVWLESAGVLEPVLTTGDRAPGVGGRTIRNVSSNPGMNNAGEIALGLVLDDSDLSNNNGVWVKRDKKFVLVARKGDPVPGIQGETFLFAVLDSLTESGLMGIRGAIDNPGGSAIDGFWFGREGDLQLVAIEGQEPPGAPGRSYINISRRAANNRGEVAIGAELDSSDLTNNSGIWMGEPGALELVIRKGDTLEVRPDEFLTLVGGSFLPGGLNSNGDLAVLAFFSNPTRRGIIVIRSKKPVVDAGPDQTVAIESGTSATVTLDGSASIDRDGTIVSYTWRENNAVLAEGETALLDLSNGDYVFELTVTDSDGFSNSDTVNIVVTKGGGGGSCNPNSPKCS